MSHSDYTFSSPRKKSERDKSIDDDDFEKFLNDSSTSDLTFKNRRQRQNEPWWMNAEDKKATSSTSLTKSFIKKPKTKLTVPLEVDETSELPQIKPKHHTIIDTIESSKTKSVFDSDEKFDDYKQQDLYSNFRAKPKLRERSRSRQSISVQESLDSTVTTATENKEESNEANLNNQSDDESKRKFSSRLDYNLDEKSKHSLFDDDLSIILRESNNNFQDEKNAEETAAIVNKPNGNGSYLKKSNGLENIMDIKDMQVNEEFIKGDHLLSNVKFMDTLDSAKNTLKKTQDDQVYLLKQQPKKNLKVQIKDNPIERHISEEGDYYEFKEHSEEKIIINIDGDDDVMPNSNVTQSIDVRAMNDEKDEDDDDVPVKDVMATRVNNNENDTQTRNDLEQLRKLYLKNLEAEMTNFETSSKLNRFEDSSSNMVKVITNELEERALHDILNDLKINIADNSKRQVANFVGQNIAERFNPIDTITDSTRKPLRRSYTNVTTKPPKKATSSKYEHVKSSGYGKAKWFPDNETNLNGLDLHYTGGRAGSSGLDEAKIEIDKLDNTYLKVSQSMKSENNFQNTGCNDIDYLMEQISSLMSEREKDRNTLVKLRDEFAEREREYKQNTETLRKQSEAKEKESKKQLQQLTTQLLEKQNLLKRQLLESKSQYLDEKQQMDQEKKYLEQEQLLSGYQTENERLYNELKLLKEALKQQHQQNEMDIQKLKIELINKNIQIDNLKQQLLQPRMGHADVAPVKLYTDDSALHDRIRQLEMEKTGLVSSLESLKQKLGQFEVNQMAIQMNSNQLIETKNVEIKKLEEHVRQLESNLKQQQEHQQESKRLNENYKNLKKIKDDYESRLLKMESENGALRMAFDEAKYNESISQEKLKQIEHQLKLKELKKQYDSAIFRDFTMNEQKVKLEDENSKLKTENYKLMTNYTDLNKKYEKLLTEHESQISQIKTTLNAQMNQQRQIHQNEIEKQLNEILLKTQQTSELKLKLDEQRVMNLKYKENSQNIEKLRDINRENELIIEKLNDEIERLKNDLHLARLYHKPNMKHVNNLNDKLVQIENKYLKREKELQDIIANTTKIDVGNEIGVESNQQMFDLIKNYQKIIENKDKELMKFRVELDSMLELLQTLKSLHNVT